MEYFCYISRSKVDQLYQGLNPGDADEWTEHQSTEQKVDTSLNADLNLARIVSLFKGGISYGRTGVIQRERKIKVQYVEKLRHVLLAIANESPIPSLARALQIGRTEPLYYYHDGSFTISEAIRDGDSPDASTVVTLQSSITDGVILSLDCSLRFFSDGSEPDGKFRANSSNSRFFAGRLSLHMQSVFVVLHLAPDQIVGTPLYLKLADTAGAAL